VELGRGLKLAVFSVRGSLKAKKRKVTVPHARGRIRKEGVGFCAGGVLFLWFGGWRLVGLVMLG